MNKLQFRFLAKEDVGQYIEHEEGVMLIEKKRYYGVFIKRSDLAIDLTKFSEIRIQRGFFKKSKDMVPLGSLGKIKTKKGTFLRLQGCECTQYINTKYLAVFKSKNMTFEGCGNEKSEIMIYVDGELSGLIMPCLMSEKDLAMAEQV